MGSNPYAFTSRLCSAADLIERFDYGRLRGLREDYVLLVKLDPPYECVNGGMVYTVASKPTASASEFKSQFTHKDGVLRGDENWLLLWLWLITSNAATNVSM